MTQIAAICADPLVVARAVGSVVRENNVAARESMSSTMRRCRRRPRIDRACPGPRTLAPGIASVIAGYLDSGHVAESRPPVSRRYVNTGQFHHDSGTMGVPQQA